MATLYRKYRPSNFKEVVNQNHVKITLENQIKTNSIGHAYLFCGPRAVGKTTLARILSKSVNCKKRQDNTSEPCNECDVCKEISKNAGLDIIEIDAASHTGVDNVRENIINNANTRPARYNYKVFIIDEVHMLSISAFNALLKIMEEPPSYIIFILCTTETHKIPQTIISRCQRFNFKKIGTNDIATKLKYITDTEKITIEKSILESIARQSGGHMRDAESLLSQVIAIGGTNITQEEADLVIPRSNIEEVVNLIEILANKNTVNGIQLINNALDNGIDLKIFTNELIETLRKTALAKTSPILAEKLAIELGEDLEKKLNAVLSTLGIPQILRFIEEFKTANLEQDNYPVAQMALELAIIKLLTTNTQEPAINQTPLAQVHTPLQTPTPPRQAALLQTQTPPQAPAQAAPPQTPIPPQTPSPTTPQTPVIHHQAPTPPQVQASEPQVTTPPPSAKASAECPSLDAIRARWPEVLTSLQTSNPSVSFVLRASMPHNLQGNTLTLNFKYKFHKDQADKPENQNIIINALKIIFNADISIATTLNAEPAPSPETPTPAETQQPIAPAPTEPQTTTPTAATDTPTQTTNSTLPVANTTPQTTEPATQQDPPNTENPENTNSVKDILDTFGGKVVK